MKNYNKNGIVAVLTVASFVLGLTSPVATLAAGPAMINLGTASDFVILAKTGISTTGSTAVTGNLGLSPAAASYITGFALTLPAAGASSTSAIVSGKIYAPGYASPTPVAMTTAISNMETAYTDGAGRTNPTATELGAGNIGGMTLAPGLYKWGTGVIIPTDVTLSGGASDVWIFQIAQNLTVSSSTKIILSGGAQASNIFWIVAGQTTIGTGAVFNGNILDQTAIILNTGATLHGRALAQTAVTLDSNTVTMPTTTAAATLTVTSNPTPTSTSSDNTGSGYVSQVSVTTAPALGINTAITMPPISVLNQEIKSIAASLFKGSRNAEVTILQRFLISQNKGTAAQALANATATGYFGLLTRAALVEFQASVGVSPAWGNFGPITRGYISAHY